MRAFSSFLRHPRKALTPRGLPVFLIFLSSGCGSGGGAFLDSVELDRIAIGSAERHEVVYFRRYGWINVKGTSTLSTHKVVRIGNDPRSAPWLLAVRDDSIRKLATFKARITSVEGSTEEYAIDQLSTASLSTSDVISESYVRYIEPEQSLKPGDFVETIVSHELSLLPLGLRFSLSELGDSGKNVSYVVETPIQDSLRFHVANDTKEPEVMLTTSTRKTIFSWDGFETPQRKSFLWKRNPAPTVLVEVRPPETSDESGTGWTAFGNWYLDLIESRLQLTSEARRIALEITSNVETRVKKMDAIFDYCQRNVRYEQVYLAEGEFIPNDIGTILSRRYGDCKDYSALIYAMGKSVGLDPNLVLTYRGRGVEFHPEIAASQFNHMIVHFGDEGKSYWYDGTNRTGLPGITTRDLINADALILSKGKSIVTQIPEHPENLMDISGSFHASGNHLKGKVTIDFSDQYAMDFFWSDFQLNENEMEDRLVRWVKRNLSEKCSVSGLRWETNLNRFSLTTDLDIPNCLTTVREHAYIRFDQVFDELFPRARIHENTESIYFYPFYGKVKAEVRIANLSAVNADGSPVGSSFVWTLSASLPPGPFTDATRDRFVESYKDVRTAMNEQHKCLRSEE